jgi:hypothetical protein
MQSGVRGRGAAWHPCDTRDTQHSTAKAWSCSTNGMCKYEACKAVSSAARTEAQSPFSTSVPQTEQYASHDELAALLHHSAVTSHATGLHDHNAG